MAATNCHLSAAGRAKMANNGRNGQRWSPTVLAGEDSPLQTLLPVSTPVHSTHATLHSNVSIVPASFQKRWDTKFCTQLHPVLCDDLCPKQGTQKCSCFSHAGCPTSVHQSLHNCAQSGLFLDCWCCVSFEILISKSCGIFFQMVKLLLAGKLDCDLLGI